MKTFKELPLHKYSLPIVDYIDGYLKMTFPFSSKITSQLVKNQVLDELSIEEIAGYEYIVSQKEVSKKEYSAYFDFDDKKSQRHLIKMKNLGLIKTNDENPKSRFLKYKI